MGDLFKHLLQSMIYMRYVLVYILDMKHFRICLNISVSKYPKSSDIY